MSLFDWLRPLYRPLPAWWPVRAALDDRALLSDRWVILDTETSGLQPARDRLLSLAAVTLSQASLPLAQQWYATLDHQDAALPAGNVLIHRLTPGLLAGGMPVTEGLETLARFVGDAPVLAFHHGHDRSFLRSALLRAGYPELPWRWWEVGDVLTLAWPDLAPCPKTLDDWLTALQVRVDERHHALEDARATALLLLKALPRLAEQGITTRQQLAQAIGHLRRLRRWRAS